jgi:hypothetical protein
MNVSGSNMASEERPEVIINLFVLEFITLLKESRL